LCSSEISITTGIHLKGSLCGARTKQKKKNEENVKEKGKKWDCPFYMTTIKIKK
jgi:hypothetical protein